MIQSTKILPGDIPFFRFFFTFPRPIREGARITGETAIVNEFRSFRRKQVTSISDQHHLYRPLIFFTIVRLTAKSSKAL